MEQAACAINNTDTPHAPIMARVDRLCRNMSSNSVTLINRKKKSGRSIPIVESRYRKRLIIIDHSGNDATELELFREHDKVYDGTVMISTTMAEEDVRQEIVEALKRKESTVFNFNEVKVDDFEFVKCTNRRLRAIDGDHPYDGKVIKQLYCGSIYVRFKSPVPLCKVCISLLCDAISVSKKSYRFCSYAL